MNRDFLTKNFVPLLIWVTGVAFYVYNMLQANQYSTVSLAKRVDAIELEQKTGSAQSAELVPQFRVVQEQIRTINSNIAEIKDRSSRMENKIDRIIEGVILK